MQGNDKLKIQNQISFLLWQAWNTFFFIVSLNVFFHAMLMTCIGYCSVWDLLDFYALFVFRLAFLFILALVESGN